MTVIHYCLISALILLYLGIVYQLLVSNKNWESKFFWLLFVWVPVIGPIIYTLAGVDYRTDKVRKRMHGKTLDLFGKEATPEMIETFFSDKNLLEVKEFFRPLARLLSTAGAGNKVHTGNCFEIITTGARKRELLIEDLRRAKKFIHMEYFRFGKDESGQEIRRILMEKASQGVEVRYIQNNMTGFFSVPRRYFREMRTAGVEERRYTLITYGLRDWIMRINHQNHRKIVVIDGEVAYTGGMNINDKYFHKWRDTHLRITGPLVGRLQASFIDTWLGCRGTLSQPLPYYFPLDVPSGNGPLKNKVLQAVTDAPEFPWPNMQFAYEWILQNARDYVYIQTPYFMPPDGVLEALKSAALRGVDVRVMLPKKVDTPFIGPANRAFYEECLIAGVRLYERNGSFIHSKTLVADDYLSVIGASNLDTRSFGLNNEVNTLVYDTETALSCKEIFLADIASTKELHLKEWKEELGVWKNLGSRFVRFFYKNL